MNLQPNPPDMIYFPLPIGRGPVTLTGSDVTLLGRPSRAFCAERFVVSAHLTIPRWLFLVQRLFRWLSVPWLVRRWDDEEERDQRRIALIRPVTLLYAWVTSRAQRRALANVFIKSVRVRNEDVLIGRLMPVLVFSPDIAAVRLDLPTCQPNDSIEIVLSGHGGPLSIVAIGRSV
jgi:hypothetical protein